MTKDPCPHLEAELEKVEAGLGHDIKLFKRGETIDHVAETMAPEVDEEAIKGYAQKLADFGLEEHEIVILIEYSICGRTYGEIAKEYGFVDEQTVGRLYRRAVGKAKKLYIQERGL